MSLELIRESVRRRYAVEERGHALAILAGDFESEFEDIQDCLDAFTLTKTHVVTKGGNRSTISIQLDSFFFKRGWKEKGFDTKIVVDADEWPTPTHGIDNFRNRVGVEVEWNNKDPFYDRDLNNFRLLHELRVLSVGVIITRLAICKPSLTILEKAKPTGIQRRTGTSRCQRLKTEATGLACYSSECCFTA